MCCVCVCVASWVRQFNLRPHEYDNFLQRLHAFYNSSYRHKKKQSSHCSLVCKDARDTLDLIALARSGF